MIESGSLTPGIDPAMFGLAPGSALRYEIPDPRLAAFVSDYHVLDSEGPNAIGAEEWVLPGWPAIRIILTEIPMSVTLGDQVYDHLPRLGFYGTTCVAMKWNTDGGATIGIRLTPAGVARLFDLDATLYRDRIVPLDQLLAPEVCSALFESLRNSDQGPAVKGILDNFLLDHMAKPHRQETEILALTELLLDNSVGTVAEASDLLALPIYKLRRISLRYFGFPARTLMIRSRFLRSLLMMKEDTAKNRHSVIDISYTDTSHFLRDCKRFLGMTALQFFALKTPYLDTVLRARSLVMGAATSAVPPMKAREPE
jgi:AraC-like DNA-binding protein